MQNLKHFNLKPILESKDGIHLTAYLLNKKDFKHIKHQLASVIDEANETLADVITEEERLKFLEPLNNLLKDPSIFKKINGNFGIFRNKETFRILNIPIEIEQSCSLATSFHVKPLLKWMQGDQDFFLIGANKDKWSLYLGNLNSIRLIDSKPFVNSRVHQINWLYDRIKEFTYNIRPKIYFCGDQLLLKEISNAIRYRNLIKKPVSLTFEAFNLNDYCREIRSLIKNEAKQKLEATLQEFRFAEESKKAKKNIFQISRAVVQGKVKKLVITDELSIFGRVDTNTGGLALHPLDLDHEDDCILDDLAQMVLSQGGEVIVAKRNEIPKGRPILAIVDEEPYRPAQIKHKYDFIENDKLVNEA